MWVTAFDEFVESILGVSVKKFSALDDDGRKRAAWGVSGLKYYMTVEKLKGHIQTTQSRVWNLPDISIEL